MQCGLVAISCHCLIRTVLTLTAWLGSIISELTLQRKPTSHVKNISLSLCLSVSTGCHFLWHSVYDNNKMKHGTQQKVIVLTVIHKT